MSDFCSKGYDFPRLQPPLGGWVGGGIPSFKGLSSISNTNQIRVLLVLLVPEVTYPHHFYKLIVSCVTLVK